MDKNLLDTPSKGIPLPTIGEPMQIANLEIPSNPIQLVQPLPSALTTESSPMSYEPSPVLTNPSQANEVTGNNTTLHQLTETKTLAL